MWLKCSRNSKGAWWLDQSKLQKGRAEEVRKVGRNFIMQGLVEYGMIMDSI